ncbi:MAG TPA: type I restriction endonuclease subunit R [Microbacteriaceae bacterium]|nr:type I restriction endonuclease subunit R [Microbacteriaceae bacterium]
MSSLAPSSDYRYDPVAISSESTVVAQFDRDSIRQTEYQSEAQLEAAFVKQLQQQAYDYLNITSTEQLTANLRSQLETLNATTFSDTEWNSLYTTVIANATAGIVDKARLIQEDHVQVLRRDNGTISNIKLIDKANIHNNRLQVINQYEAVGTQSNRYDVTILVNGLPLVHVELKRRGVDLREAFNQINRYQRESFWADSGLFQYVQLFVISNGTYTKYYSNTTRQRAVDETQRGGTKRTSNSYEFTSWWADANNRRIEDLASFTKTFFAKHAILNILTKYCVFTVDRDLLVMRPYQIAATEQILQRIVISNNDKTRLGTLAGGGYIWHTTGSGKTLTSFKAAQLATRMPEIDKVLFVVDRKDLDWQTQREYDKFEKGAANSNTSTAELKRQIEDPNTRIIITTMQKLSIFADRHDKHEAYSGRYVLIFDECHRSQFGDMHTLIKKRFKNYNLFGFTGTPIFAANASSGGNAQLKTTEQAFGERLHTYTIVDAIGDGNVLPFRIDYVNTIRAAESLADRQVSAIDMEQALLAPERISQIVRYIREHFDQKTRRNQAYTAHDKRQAGFNSILATASIDAGKRYYTEFKKQQAELPPNERLKVGIIYSYAANEAEPEAGFLDEEVFETSQLDSTSREFLESALADYSAMYSGSFDTSSDGFARYYSSISEKLKKREIDIVIVVNMFLTGFDATTLNTLWVDKNLRQHGLIQAFSRTNRILNSVKSYGNIVAFRNLEDATNEAIALFGNRDARGIVLLRPYGEYLAEYQKVLAELQLQFSPGELPTSEELQKTFVELWGQILRLRNILVSFDEFKNDDPLSDFDRQDYTGAYLEIRNMHKAADDGKESILDDVVFEIELIKQVEITIDYILMMVRKSIERDGGPHDREAINAVMRQVDASATLRSKRDLIERFIDHINVDSDVDDSWQKFVEQQREQELDAIIASEGLRPNETRAFMERAFEAGALQTYGTAVTKILPPVDMFAPDNALGRKKESAIEKLSAFFERFFGLG